MPLRIHTFPINVSFQLAVWDSFYIRFYIAENIYNLQFYFKTHEYDELEAI